MTEDKKPEQNGPPSKPNQNHRGNDSVRGGPDGGRNRFSRFGPRRDRERDGRVSNKVCTHTLINVSRQS